MNESVLTSVKKLLGLAEEYTPFDEDILVHINSVFMNLRQLGVTSSDVYIMDSSTKWPDVISDIENLALVKSYVYLKVRLIFDPPASNVEASYTRAIQEMEWRLVAQKEVELFHG